MNRMPEHPGDCGGAGASGGGGVCGGGHCGTSAPRRANTWPLWFMAAVLAVVGIQTGEKPWFALALIPAVSAMLWQLALNWAGAKKNGGGR